MAMPTNQPAHKVATMQSFIRRYKEHAPTVIGKAPTVDLEIAYKQLLWRTQATIALGRCINKWCSTHSDEYLVDMLKPMATIELYMKAVRGSMAPDMRLCQVYARFYADIRDRSVIRVAMKTINIAELSAICASLAQIAQSKPAPPPAQVEAQCSQAESSPQADGKQPAKKKRTLANIGERLALDAPPSVHVMTMLGEGFKTNLTKTPGNSYELRCCLSDVVEDFQITRTLLDAMSLGDADSATMSELLGASALLFQCLHIDDREKPSATFVRTARRLVFSTTKSSNAILADFAKSLLTCGSGKLAMEASKVHSALGLEDDTADRCFQTLVADFETTYAGAFENVEGWLAGVNSQEANIKTTMEKLEPINDMITALSSAILRWSPAAIERKVEEVAAVVTNMSELVGAALAFCVKLVAARFDVLVWGLRGVALAPAASCRDTPSAGARSRPSRMARRPSTRSATPSRSARAPTSSPRPRRPAQRTSSAPPPCARRWLP